MKKRNIIIIVTVVAVILAAIIIWQYSRGNSAGSTLPATYTLTLTTTGPTINSMIMQPDDYSEPPAGTKVTANTYTINPKKISNYLTIINDAGGHQLTLRCPAGYSTISVYSPQNLNFDVNKINGTSFTYTDSVNTKILLTCSQ